MSRVTIVIACLFINRKHRQDKVKSEEWAANSGKRTVQAGVQ